MGAAASTDDDGVKTLRNCDDDAFNDDDIMELVSGFDDDVLFRQPCKDLNLIIRQSDDAPWILSSAFMILTMQSGFAMLEKGYLDPKHSVNTMVKNVVDIVVGGAMFWLFGYGIAFGSDSNAFTGYSDFFFEPDTRIHKDVDDDDDFGHGWKDGDRNLVKQTDAYASWIFHFAFASTATTIVSGSVAGRMKMSSYTIWAFFAPLFYAFVAHWVWAQKGWLYRRGFTDFAGCGPVHLFGACGSLSGIFMVGPRLNRFAKLEDGEGKNYKEIYEPEAVIQGTLILWWGWIGFNCGSTFGTTGTLGAVAVRVGVVTVVSTIFGAMTELIKIFLPTVSKDLRTAGSFVGHQIVESKVGAALARGVSVKFTTKAPMKNWRQSSMPTDDEVTEAAKLAEKERRAAARAAERENKEDDEDLEDGPLGRRRTLSLGERMRRDSIVKMTKGFFEVTDNRIKVPGLTNAILAALVSITAPCNCVTPRVAVFIGCAAPFIANFANKKVESLHLDDPCGAVGVHGACGIWGLLCCGLFSDRKLPGVDKDGLFYSWNQKGAEYLGIQLLGAFVIAVWGICTNLFLFKTVERLTGGLRVDVVTEERGIDEADHATMTMEAKLMGQLADRRGSARDSYRENFNPMGLHEESSMLDVMFASGMPVSSDTDVDGTEKEVEMKPHVSFNMDAVNPNSSS